jgi:hypothetical protein
MNSLSFFFFFFLLVFLPVPSGEYVVPDFLQCLEAAFGNLDKLLPALAVSMVGMVTYRTVYFGLHGMSDKYRRRAKPSLVTTFVLQQLSSTTTTAVKCSAPSF